MNVQEKAAHAVKVERAAEALLGENIKSWAVIHTQLFESEDAAVTAADGSSPDSYLAGFAAGVASLHEQVDTLPAMTMEELVELIFAKAWSQNQPSKDSVERAKKARLEAQRVAVMEKGRVLKKPLSWFEAEVGQLQAKARAFGFTGGLRTGGLKTSAQVEAESRARQKKAADLARKKKEKRREKQKQKYYDRRHR